MQDFQYCMHWSCQTTPLRCQKKGNKVGLLQAFWRLQRTDIKVLELLIRKSRSLPHLFPRLYTHTHGYQKQAGKQDMPSVNVKSPPTKQLGFSKSFSCVHFHRKTGLLYIYFIRKNTLVKHMPVSSLIPVQNSLPTETTSFT